jgi:hypothetical protein
MSGARTARHPAPALAPVLSAVLLVGSAVD